MAKGADVNAKDEDERGKTPLDIANTWGHGPAVATLRKHGAKTGEELKAEGEWFPYPYQRFVNPRLS